MATAPGIYNDISQYTTTVSSATAPSGWTCSQCGSFVYFNYPHSCSPYQCPPVSYPQYLQYQIIPQMVPVPDWETRNRLEQIQDELNVIKDILGDLLDRLDNRQDEEVRGYSEGECQTNDTGGVPGMALEVRAESKTPRSKGATTWPPRSE